jgi:predicted regulator of Ras-like GTPase activity (Roadblock/LC7/MglB family)
MSFAARALRDLNSSQPATPLPTPAAPTLPPFRPSAEANPLLVSLISLAEGWPEAVRQELVQLNLVDARVALPTEVVERALKQGRVAFTWKTLRSWIKPAPLPVVSAHDSSVLELPLKVVAPPFLARQKETAKFKKKVSVDDEIPNLFFGFPRPESGSAMVASASSPAAAKSADTNFYVWDDNADTARVQGDIAKPSPSPGTKFVAKYATPNEVVSRAAALDGVAGALIALPDGLMVASRLSSDLNGDTLAAFLPQIFGKVNQCTKELRMGELNNVNFTVGNVPWKIFRVNAIFFAAFSRAGEPLPTMQLAALAAELDHRPK